MSLATLEHSAPLPEQVGFADILQPNEIQNSILDVDFAAQAAAGRTTLVLDAESTFVEFDGWEVELGIIDKLQQAREDGIERIIITTNKRPKDDFDLWQLEFWAEQINADLVIVPLAKEERKPSPHMLLKVMERYDVKAEQMMMIGDKLTSDVKAANRAGVYSVWVDRLGDADHFGDRAFRRPMERMVAQLVLEDYIAEQEYNPPQYEVNPNKKPGKPREIEVHDYIREKGLIAGYGGPEITLSEDKLALIPPPASEKVLGPVKNLVPVAYKEWFDNFMAEHGGLVADTFTYSRLALGALSLALLLRGHKKAAFVTYCAAQATDFIDGWASRKSKEDPQSEHRSKMATIEANIDKALVIMTGTGLVWKGSMPLGAFGLIQAREAHRTFLQRKDYDALGYDTRATLSTKAATGVVAVVLGSSMLGEPGLVNTTVNYAAAAAKWASTFYSPREWQYKLDRKNKANAIKAQLLGY